MVFQESFKSVCSFKVFFKEILSVIIESFKENAGKFHDCFKNVSRVFQVRLKGVLRVFERS